MRTATILTVLLAGCSGAPSPTKHDLAMSGGDGGGGGDLAMGPDLAMAAIPAGAA